MREGNPEIIGTSPVSDPGETISKIGDAIIFSSSVACGYAHIMASYIRAKRNMERGTAKGSTLATEFFRQITGERQVSRAIERARISEGEKAVIIAHNPEIIEELGLERDDSAIGCRGEHCEDECLERSALVDIS
jgi:tRNA threonylcarbamoyladenosine modification (KEOPS) complex Cgi121 subunit